MERLTDVLVNAYEENKEEFEQEVYADIFMKLMNGNEDDAKFIWDMAFDMLKGSVNEQLSEEERQVCRMFGGLILPMLVLERFGINIDVIENMFNSPETEELMRSLTPEMGEEMMHKILNS